MYSTRTAPEGATRDPGRLTPRELASIEERARSLGGNYVNVAAAMTLARHDVPALLAEVRRLRERLEEGSS
ncbi:MAG TPA: hypothetical protein VGR37_07920 [Longimicrobiaceae bacterium]|nr:hypothetical protein [Longimicrobiaceae bacterium]